MMKIFKSIALVVLAGTFLLASCSTDANKRGAKDAASALVNANKNIVSFGHLSIDQILNKMEYKNIPMINAIVGVEYDSWSKGLDLTKPVYYAVEAPFDYNGNPSAAYGLFDVKDAAALKEKLSSAGYTLEKNGDIDWYQMDDLSLGIRNNLAVIVMKTAKYDGKAEIQAVFKATEADLSEGKAKDILNKEGDIVLGMSIERLFMSATTALNQLPDTKKKELEAIVTNSYTQTVVDFGKGNMTMKTDHLFSDAMNDAMPFSEKSSNVVSKLGGGTPWMGLSGNLDMSKFDSFINNYAPDLRKKFFSKHSELKAASLLLGDSVFEQLFSGQFGFVAVSPVAEGSLPEFNAYIGLGSQGNIVSKLVTANLVLQGSSVGNAFDLYGEEITANSNEIRVLSANHKTGSLQVPAFAKGFGSKTLAFFMNFENMDLDSFGLRPEQQALKLVKHLYIVSDKDGTELVVVAKDESTNILKQIALFYVNIAQGKLANM